MWWPRMGPLVVQRSGICSGLWPSAQRIRRQSMATVREHRDGRLRPRNAGRDQWAASQSTLVHSQTITSRSDGGLWPEVCSSTATWSRAMFCCKALSIMDRHWASHPSAIVSSDPFDLHEDFQKVSNTLFCPWAFWLLQSVAFGKIHGPGKPLLFEDVTDASNDMNSFVDYFKERGIKKFMHWRCIGSKVQELCFTKQSKLHGSLENRKFVWLLTTSTARERGTSKELDDFYNEFNLVCQEIWNRNNGRGCSNRLEWPELCNHHHHHWAKGKILLVIL